VFFSFPHTAINESGELGVISRPNRPGASCACGALAKVGGAARACGRQRPPQAAAGAAAACGPGSML
jgi:hypothetical protein